MTTTNWKSIRLTGDPILVVGLRSGSKIEGHRVVVDRNVHPPLRKVADDALGRVGAMKAISYTPYVDPGDDEYLSLDPATLTISVRADGDGGPTSQKQQTAQLLHTVQNADTLPTIGAKQLITRLDDLYFQAVCLHTSPAIVSFVTKATGRQVIKRSAIPLGMDNVTDRFKSVSRPELVLESEVHTVMAPGEIAILNRPQFQFMVGDIGLVAQYVPAQIRLIGTRLKNHGIPLSTATSRAIEAKATDSVQLAKRLDAFLERIDEIDVARITSGRGFSAQDLKKKDFVNAKGELECEPGRVLELIDALEGRFFDDGFTSEKRRADRFRKRS
jgi:hypothetical protein